MRSEILRNNYCHVEKMIELIETCIAQKMKPTEIGAKLNAESMLHFNYFNAIFSTVTGHTLAKYIRRRQLTVLFEKWKKTQSNLCENSSYERYPRFAKSFCKEFGITITDAVNLGYIEEQLQPKLNIETNKTLMETLDYMDIVDDYTLKNGLVEMQLNKKELLLFQLQLPVYIFPYIYFKPYKNMQYEQKVLFVASFDKFYRLENSQYVVKITNQEFETMRLQLMNYDFIKSGKILIVKPRIASGLKKEFEKIVNIALPSIYSTLPRELISEELADELQLIEKCTNIGDLCTSLKKNLPETVNYLWKYFLKGYLRVVIKRD